MGEGRSLRLVPWFPMWVTGGGTREVEAVWGRAVGSVWISSSMWVSKSQDLELTHASSQQPSMFSLPHSHRKGSWFESSKKS